VGDVQEKTYRILLLSRIRTGEDRQGMNKENSLRIWPFFDYEREEAGHTTFSFLYLFPFKEEGFERNLFPLFRIFRWEKDPEGRKSTNFLWGLYKRIEKEDLDYWEVAHLIEVKNGGHGKRVSLLKGLFYYQSDGENAGLRLFYIPFYLRWSRRHPLNLSLTKREGRRSLIQDVEDDLKSEKKEFADGRQ